MAISFSFWAKFCLAVCLFVGSVSTMDLVCQNLPDENNKTCIIYHNSTQEKFHIAVLPHNRDYHTVIIHSMFLKVIPDEIFINHFTNVRKLEMTRGKIEKIPAKIFDGADDLEDLDLERNAIKSLDAKAFDGAVALKILDLSFNYIETIDDDAFDGLPDLRVLHLMYTKIKVISENLFNDLPSLVELDMSHNEFTKFHPRALVKNPLLEEVDLDHGNYTKLELIFANSNLDLLDVSDGKVRILLISSDSESLPDCPYDLTILAEDNFIHKFQVEDDFPVTFLNLSDNRLDNDDIEGISKLVTLKVLDLSGNKFTKLNLDQMDDLVRLEELHLENSRLDNYSPSDIKSRIKTLKGVEYSYCPPDSKKASALCREIHDEDKDIKDDDEDDDDDNDDDDEDDSATAVFVSSICLLISMLHSVSSLVW